MGLVAIDLAVMNGAAERAGGKKVAEVSGPSKPEIGIGRCPGAIHGAAEMGAWRPDRLQETRRGEEQLAVYIHSRLVVVIAESDVVVEDTELAFVEPSALRGGRADGKHRDGDAEGDGRKHKPHHHNAGWWRAEVPQAGCKVAGDLGGAD